MFNRSTINHCTNYFCLPTGNTYFLKNGTKLIKLSIVFIRCHRRHCFATWECSVVFESLCTDRTSNCTYKKTFLSSNDVGMSLDKTVRVGILISY